MRSIMFNLKKDSNEKQDGLLHRLSKLPGIAQASSLNPQAKHPDLRRMCFAHVADDADIERVLAEIRHQPEVEEASLPAERGLV